MSVKNRKNIVASVLAKLRNASNLSGTLLQQILQQYAMERFLYRISKSSHAQSVVLKGALLLKTIGIPNSRPTIDIDMLRIGKADQASLLALVKDCATIDVAADGLHFIADSAVAEEITKDSEYKGNPNSNGCADGQRAAENSDRFRRWRCHRARPEDVSGRLGPVGFE